MRDLSDIFAAEREKNMNRHKTVHRRLAEHIWLERAAKEDRGHGDASSDMAEVNFLPPERASRAA